MEKKGTVTQLSSMFPAEEAQRASRQVQGAITERQQQLNQVKAFIDDNVGLINLVHKLPEDTHHSIMVPFGKAAFFPGRLIHTNEFMVLLGEGYYAERTSKQTTEILKRRGKALETQVESLKAIMQDLKAEASFFDTTADESAEGLVEIREEYVEEGSSMALPMAGNKTSDNISSLEVDDRKASAEDEEYSSLISRIAELEKEEEEAEKANESVEDELRQNEPDSSINQILIDQEVKSLLVDAPIVPAVSKDGSSHEDFPAPNNGMMNKILDLPREEKKVSSHEDFPAPNNSMMNKSLDLTREEKKIEPPFSANQMAFTGSIVEHAPNIRTNLPEQQTGARGSRPVSRFKMQRK